MKRQRRPRQEVEQEQIRAIENAPENEDTGITEKRTGKRTFDTIRNMDNKESDGSVKSANTVGKRGNRRSTSSASQTRANLPAAGKKPAGARKRG